MTPVSAAPGAPGVLVDVPVGATASDIARRLKRAGLIRSEIVFKLAARLYGGSEDLKAGEYRLSPNLGIFEILDRLNAGDAEARWVVIPEGLTLAETARRLEARRVAAASRFLRLARRKPAALGLEVPVSRASVEGYLMPDTYRFHRDSGEREVLTAMLQNWQRKVQRPYSTLFRASAMPLDKIVIIASLIEREARVDEDRALISSVIRNRLKARRRLEIDATVIYALGSHKNELSLADLRVDSPYNTYRHAGLPPGPICSPGVKSIEAALRPAATPYQYYVARPDGRHIFTTTYEEHRAAIARVRQMAGSARPGAPPQDPGR